jgi:hypothetical protein
VWFLANRELAERDQTTNAYIMASRPSQSNPFLRSLRSLLFNFFLRKRGRRLRVVFFEQEETEGTEESWLLLQCLDWAVPS